MKNKSVTQQLREAKQALDKATSLARHQQEVISGLKADLAECGRVAQNHSGNPLYDKSWPEVTPLQHVQKLRDNYQHMLAMFGLIAADVFRGVRLTELIDKLDEQYKKRKEDTKQS